MKRSGWVTVLGAGCLLMSGALLVSRAQNPVTSNPLVASDPEQLPVEHPDCTFFGPERDKFVRAALQARGLGVQSHGLSDLTDRVVQTMSYVPPGSPTYGFQQSQNTGSIDSYI